MFERKDLRLKKWDYTSSGMYYVTICTQGRENLFGCVENGVMILSDFGKIIYDCWNAIPGHFNCVRMDEYIIMPNHIHGIIEIVGEGLPLPVKSQCATQGGVTPPLRTLGQILGYFKYKSTKGINEYRNMPGCQVLQRSYYDHIIRNDEDLNRIRRYICDNPVKWRYDKYFA